MDMLPPSVSLQQILVLMVMTPLPVFVMAVVLTLLALLYSDIYTLYQLVLIRSE